MINNTTIITATGRWIDFTNPDPKQISIIDIAAAVANINRYTGHTGNSIINPTKGRAYSVAEHSVRMYLQAPTRLRKSALMHDAAEAFVNDLASPIRGLIPDHKRIEANLMAAIETALGFTLDYDTIKHIDMSAWATEHTHFFSPDTHHVTRDQHRYEWDLYNGALPINLGSIQEAFPSLHLGEFDPLHENNHTPFLAFLTAYLEAFHG